MDPTELLGQKISIDSPSPVSMDQHGDPIQLLGQRVPGAGGEDTIRQSTWSEQDPYYIASILDTFLKGYSTVKGAAVGTAVGGPAGSVPGAVAGGVAGEGLADRGMQGVDELAHAISPDKYGEPPAHDVFNEQNVTEGASMAAVDRGLAGTGKVLRPTFEKLADFVSPLGSKTGNRRFKTLEKDPRRAERIDPNFDDPVTGGKIVEALQPNMGEFDEKVRPNIVSRIREAQEMGYLNDVASPQELQAKLRADLGHGDTAEMMLPNGEMVMQDIRQQGRIGKTLADQTDQLSQIEQQGRLPPVPFVELEKRVANQLGKLIDDNPGAVEPNVVKAAYQQQMPQVMVDFSKHQGQTAADFLTINKLRQAFDRKAGDAFSKAPADISLDDHVTKAIANGLRDLEEEQAAHISPEIASVWKQTKRQYQVLADLRDVVSKTPVRAMKAGSGVGNSVVKNTIANPKAGIFSALRDMLVPAETAERTFEQGQIAAKLRGDPVTADVNLNSAGLGERIKSLIEGAPVGATVEAPLRAGAVAADVAGSPAARRIADPLLAPYVPDAAEAVGNAVVPEANAAPPMPGVAPAPTPGGGDAIRGLLPMLQGPQQGAGGPFPRSTEALIQNQGPFLQAIQQVAAQPRGPMDAGIPPEVLQSRGAAIAGDVSAALQSGNTFRIKQIMGTLSKQFPELFQRGSHDSLWDGVIVDPAERMAYADELEHKHSLGEVPADFLAKQSSVLNDPNDGRVLEIPVKSRTQLTDAQIAQMGRAGPQHVQAWMEQRVMELMQTRGMSEQMAKKQVENEIRKSGSARTPTAIGDRKASPY